MQEPDNMDMGRPEDGEYGKGEPGRAFTPERRRFDRFLVPFAERCLSTPFEQLNRMIEQRLYEVNSFFSSDRVLLWEILEDGQKACLTHSYVKAGAEPPAQSLLNDTLPYIFDSVSSQKDLCVSRLKDLPQEADTDRQYLEFAGIRSFMVIPLMVGGALRGALSLASIRTGREWSHEDLLRFKRVGEVLSALIDRSKWHYLLDRRIEFETMITNMSARLIKAPTNEVDGVIENALAQVRKFFQADRCALLGVNPNRKFVTVTHASYGEGFEPVSGDINLADLFPWSYDILVNQGGHINYSCYEELPPEAEVELESRLAMDIVSAMSVSLSVSGKVTNIILLNTMREKRTWPEEYVPRLKLLGEILVNTLERKQSEQSLQERLGFELLLGKISARFANLPANRIDDEIENIERSVCEFLNLDLVALWQWSDRTPDSIMATHVYTTQESPYPLDQVTKEHFPWYIQQILAGKTVAVSSLADLPAKAAKDRESCRLFGVKSNLSLPLSVGSGPPIGLLGFNTTRTERDWPDELVKRLQLIAQMFANGLQRKRMEGRLKQRLHEIQELKQRLEQENFYLRDEVALLHDHSGIICESRVMKFVLHQLEQVARTDSTVLIAGETGTGKELLAREIHALSSRKGRTLVVVNCASLSPTLIESELFGREKGAYTGAMTRMAGRFEIADGSTLFLDEIGELPLDLQSKLLRVIEEGSLERLGSTRIIHVNVRIIAATNRDLSEEVERGAFRQDLFYRLNVFPLTMPPLRERREDIPPLIWAFVRNFEKKMGKHIEKIPGRSMEALQNWSWPGNVRELRNIIEHAMIITRGKTLEVVMPKVNADEHAEEQHISLESAERKHIQAVLQRCGWRISGAGGAAEALGLKRTTLQSKMKKLGIERPVY